MRGDSPDVTLPGRPATRRPTNLSGTLDTKVPTHLTYLCLSWRHVTDNDVNPVERARVRLRHRHRPLRGITRPAALVAAALLVITVQGPAGAAQAAPPRKPLGATEFRSSFESGEPQPDWTNTVDTGPDGRPRTSGVGPETTPAAPGMSTGTDSGPGDSPTAKAHAGFTGTHALRYAGTHTADGHGYSYNKIFDVDLGRHRGHFALVQDLPRDGEERPGLPGDPHLASTWPSPTAPTSASCPPSTSTARR